MGRGNACAVDAILHELELDRAPRLHRLQQMRRADRPICSTKRDTLCVSARTGAGLDALRAGLVERVTMILRSAVCDRRALLRDARRMRARRNPDDAFVAAVRACGRPSCCLRCGFRRRIRRTTYDEAYATGFVIASGSWGSDVLTVQHAIDGAWNLHVTVGNRTSTPARVVAANEDLDLALLRTPRGRTCRSIALGSSAQLQSDVGREVGLLGYPIPDEFDDEGLGLATSLNAGRLSSIRKDALEVTLSIVPGESGAPVFIADTGEIIGVADSRFDDEHSIGFALPIDDAKKFLHHFDRGSRILSACSPCGSDDEEPNGRRSIAAAESRRSVASESSCARVAAAQIRETRPRLVAIAQGVAGVREPVARVIELLTLDADRVVLRVRRESSARDRASAWRPTL